MSTSIPATPAAATAKLALITGASRGLGRSMALHLAAAGVDVVGTYRQNPDEAAAVAQAIEAHGRRAAMLPLDVGDVAQFERFAQSLATTLRTTFGRDRFDFLVNNGGHGLQATIAETTEADFDGIVNVHFKGPFFLTQRLLPLIAHGGRILNVSSGLARFSYPGSAAYGAAKGALEVFTRYLARELGARGITANVVAPGPIATDFRGGAVRDTPEVNRQLAAATALGRVGEADDVGGVVELLLADGARWINGQRIEVAGGINL